ncbi:hypothetical protein BJF84_21525 [Rhodococcus sp. CUA-806]|nr:hypothetical protein BJF84_21525 [Rhodococcus sp. CUA-806]
MSAKSVDRTLDALSVSQFDAVADLAVGVPRGVICHLLGVPEEDWAMLAEKQNAFLMIFSPAPLPEHLMASLDEVTTFYLDYFDSILARTPEAEYSDYVRTLVDGEKRGDLTHTEVLSLMHTVFDAGYETTRTSISNTVELLATVPGLFETLSSAAPAEIDNAIEEILRVRAPIHARDRILTEDYTASDGTVVPAAPGCSTCLQRRISTRTSTRTRRVSILSGSTPKCTTRSAVACTTASGHRSHASSCRRR